MLKEIKILLYLFVIVLFFFLTIKFYLSDAFEKDVYRSYNNHESFVNEYSEKLELIKSDTDNIIEYNNNTNSSKKKYQFWKLIEND